MIRYYWLIGIIILTPLFVQAQTEEHVVIVNETFANASLAKVLRTLRKNYDLKIAYDNELINHIKVNVKIKDDELNECLERIFEGTDLEYITVNGKIVIVPKQHDTVNHPSNYNFKVTGIIKDEQSGETLPNALIKIRGTNKGTVSNKDGFFTILSVPNDTCKLEIRYVGYHRKIVSLSSDSDLSNLLIGLANNAEMLEDIIVTDQYENTLQVSATPSKIAFNPKSLTSLPSLGEHDLFKTLQLMPGISGTNESSSGLVIRGSLPSQNLVLLDGFTIYHLDHFFGIFSALNSDIIKDVQIYKSGFGSKYGGRVSGVVDITGKNGNSNQPKFNFGANLVSMRGSAEVPISKKFSIMASLRRAYTDAIQSGLYKKLFDIARKNDEQLRRPEALNIPQLEELEPTFHFNDFNTKLSYKPTDKDIVSFSLYGGTDLLTINNANDAEIVNLNFSESLDETTEWGNVGFSLRWGRQWSEKFYSNLRLSASDFFRNYSFNYGLDIDSADFAETSTYNLEQQNDIGDINLAIDNEWLVDDRTTIDFGLSTIGHGISYITSSADEIIEESDDSGAIASLYGNVKLKITEKLEFTGGIRINYHGTNDEEYREPRIALNYKLSNRLNLKAAAGKYHQFVNQILYDNPYNGTQNFWAFSTNEGIPVVSSNHYVFGATYKSKSFIFDIEAYYKDLDGITEFNLVPFYVREGFLNFGFFTNGKGRIRGLDFLLQKETGKHTGWIAYTLSRALQSFPSVDNGTFYPSLQDQTHELKVVNMIRLGKWDLSSTWIYGSGKPFAEFDILYFNNDNKVEDFVAIKDHKNPSRLPSYHRLDLSAAYNFKIQSKYLMQVGLSIFNAYGHVNIKNRKLDISELTKIIGTEVRLPPTYRDLELIDFTPSIFVNLSF